MMTNLYREEILEHFHDPQNFGMPDTYDKKAHQANPFCGDDITMFVDFEDGKVIDIHFSGHGCAISIAAASLLTEYAKAKAKTQLTKMSEDDMLDLLQIDISETRKKCALLALAVLKECLE